MRTMIVMDRQMERQPLEKRKQIRVNAPAWAALKRTVAAMTGRGRLAWEGKELTQEALVCASWLWMESMEPDALEAALAPHVRRLAAIVAGEADPGVAGHLGHPILPTVEATLGKVGRAAARRGDALAAEGDGGGDAR